MRSWSWQRSNGEANTLLRGGGLALRHGPELLGRRAGISRPGARVAAREPPGGPARQGGRKRAPLEGGAAALARNPGPAGLDRAVLAAGIRRHRLERGAAIYLRGRMRLRRRAAAHSLRPHDVRVGALQVRHARAEEALPAAHL